MTVDIRVHADQDSFDTVVRAEWERCSAGLGMLFQHAVVRASFDRWDARVLTASRGKQLLGYVCTLMEPSHGTAASHPAQTLTDPSYLRLDDPRLPGHAPELSPEYLAQIRQELLAQLTPVLVARNGLESRVVTSPELTRAERVRIVGLLVDAVRDHAHQEGASAAFARVHADDDLLMEALTARKWGGCLVSGGARLNLGADVLSFDDYLRGLSKKRRNSVKHEMKVFADAGMTVAEQAVDGFLVPFSLLEAQTYAKHGAEMPPEELVERRSSWSRALGEHLHAAACRRGDTLVGGLLFYRRDERMDVLTVGFDYDAVEDTFAYFNTAFYWVIGHALQHGVRTIDFGTEALPGKLFRGAELYGLQLHVNAEASRRPGVSEWLELVNDRNGGSSWARPLAARIG